MRAAAILAVVIACSSPKQAPIEQHSAPTPRVVKPLARGSIVTWQPLDPARPFVATHVRGTRDAPCVISRDGRVACWGRLHPDDDGPPEFRAGVATPLELAGVTDATDVIINWFWICVAQKSGPGGCYALKGELNEPAPVFSAPPVELAANDGATCARMRDGRVECIDLDNQHTVVANIANATRLACAGRGCCAIVDGGKLACFGDGDHGELAINSKTRASAPKLALPPATDVKFTFNGGCVRTQAGGAACWGDEKARSRASGVRALFGSDGELCLLLDADGALDCGDASRMPSTKDVVDAGDACVVHGDNTVACYGSNQYGELGDGHPVLSLVPKQVPVENAKGLRVAHTEACAVTTDDHLWCWGGAPIKDLGAEYGAQPVVGQYLASCLFGASLFCSVAQLGTWQSDSSPVQGPGAPVKVRAAAIDRADNLCAIDGAGAIRCRFSMGEDGPSARWVALATPRKAIDIEPLSTGFCAILDDATVGCFVDHRWDEDERTADALPKSKLERVAGLAGVTRLATGSSSACAIANEGRVWCWSARDNHVTELPTLRGATRIAANEQHECVVLRGEVWCWGDGRLGQLGDGTVTSRIEPRPTPVKANISFTAVDVGVGRDSTCALDDHHHVWCWGGDVHAELGQGRPTMSRELVTVVGLSKR